MRSGEGLWAVLYDVQHLSSPLKTNLTIDWERQAFTLQSSFNLFLNPECVDSLYGFMLLWPTYYNRHRVRTFLKAYAAVTHASLTSTHSRTHTHRRANQKRLSGTIIKLSSIISTYIERVNTPVTRWKRLVHRCGRLHSNRCCRPLLRDLNFMVGAGWIYRGDTIGKHGEQLDHCTVACGLPGQQWAWTLRSLVSIRQNEAKVWWGTAIVSRVSLGPRMRQAES